MKEKNPKRSGIPLHTVLCEKLGYLSKRLDCHRPHPSIDTLKRYHQPNLYYENMGGNGMTKATLKHKRSPITEPANHKT
jgi:hypothetical protein